jgi:hypothetical protein
MATWERCSRLPAVLASSNTPACRTGSISSRYSSASAHETVPGIPHFAVCLSEERVPTRLVIGKISSDLLSVRSSYEAGGIADLLRCSNSE